MSETPPSEAGKQPARALLEAEAWFNPASSMKVVTLETALAAVEQATKERDEADT